MYYTTVIEELLRPAVDRIVSLPDVVNDWVDMNFKKLRQIIGVKGSGTISERTLAVSSYLRLHLSFPGTVELIASDEEKVVVSTDDNLQNFVQAVNSGRTLYISADGRLQMPVFTRLHIRIYIRQLDTLRITHSGGDFEMTELYQSRNTLDVKIQSDGNVTLRLEAPAIKLISQTKGNVRLMGRCQRLSAKVQNDGDFDAREMKAAEVDFINQSNGNAWIYGSESLTIRHQANGFLYYFGEGRLKDCKQYGNGPMQHKQEMTD